MRAQERPEADGALVVVLLKAPGRGKYERLAAGAGHRTSVMRRPLSPAPPAPPALALSSAPLPPRPPKPTYSDAPTPETAASIVTMLMSLTDAILKLKDMLAYQQEELRLLHARIVELERVGGEGEGRGAPLPREARGRLAG